MTGYRPYFVVSQDPETGLWGWRAVECGPVPIEGKRYLRKLDCIAAVESLKAALTAKIRFK
jgi:hypothetical protein